MAARAYAGNASTYRARRRPAPRRKVGARRRGSRIQWDRVGRIALTLVLAAVLYSYLNPAINFVKTYTATSAAKAQRAQLQAENTRLHRRIQGAEDPIVLARKARAQGMVAPGETPLVVRGLKELPILAPGLD
jgi:cell division protein FtsB